MWGLLIVSFRLLSEMTHEFPAAWRFSGGVEQRKYFYAISMESRFRAILNL